MTECLKGCRLPEKHDGVCRDGKQQPRILLLDGTVRSYSRSSGYGKVLEDLNALMGWKCRMVLLGVLAKPDLMERAKWVADNRNGLAVVAEQALEAGGATKQATRGTSVHSLTEYVDRGQWETLTNLPDAIMNDLRAYRNRLDEYEVDPLSLEVFTVQDMLRCAGTYDREVHIPDPCPVCGKQTYIADLKTSSTVNYPHSWAVQLAIYANSERYDIATRERSPMDVCKHRGVLIHLPAEQSECELYWIDIAKGWQIATELVPAMKAWRSHKQVLTPF